MLGGALFTLGARVASWESKLHEFDQKLSDRWTYSMERESWFEMKRLNPQLVIPDTSNIRSQHAARPQKNSSDFKSVYVPEESKAPIN